MKMLKNVVIVVGLLVIFLAVIFAPFYCSRIDYVWSRQKVERVETKTQEEIYEEYYWELWDEYNTAVGSIEYFRDGWLKQTQLTNEQFVELEKLKVDNSDVWYEFTALLDYVNQLEYKKESTLVDIIPQVKPSVVHIQCPSWQLSGFIVSPHIIVTARHGVEDVEDFEITLDDGTVVDATRAISSKDHDVAFIWVEEELPNPVIFGSIEDCQLGQEVFAIGSPYGQINFNSVTTGIISGLDRNWDMSDPYTGKSYGWEVAFTTQTPGHSGNSGCAVFDMRGRVLGILVGGYSPVLVCVIPVDLLPSLEEIRLMFLMDEYKFEKEPEYPEYDPGYYGEGGALWPQVQK